MRAFASAFGRVRDFLQEAKGAAAVEFVIWLTVLTIPLMSVVDIGVYAFDRMQLQIAGQAGAQSIWQICRAGSTQYPAPVTTSSTYCGGSNLTTTATNAAQVTSLGTGVSVSSITEGYYCADSSGTLHLVGSTGTVGSPPTAQTSCSSVVAGSTTIPGDYVAVTVSYTYSPLFSGISAASLLATPITQTAMMRLQ